MSLKGKFKRFKKYTKKTTSKFGKYAKKTAKKGLRFVGSIALYGAFAPLLPFQAMMKKALRKKGIATSKMKLPELSKQFYNRIVVPSSHMESYNLEAIPENFDFETAYAQHAEGTGSLVQMGMDMTKETFSEDNKYLKIVTVIIKYFKNLINGKKKGTIKTEDEADIADDAQKIVEDLKQKEQYDVLAEANEAGGFGGVSKKSAKKEDSPYMMYILLAVVAIIIFKK